MSEFNAQPTSHIFISQRLRLHYLDWGNEQAPPLLLLHGGRDHAHSWDWVARELQRDWHVIAPDLRGHGDSVWSPDGAYFMPYFIYDLAQLIHQQGLEKVSRDSVTGSTSSAASAPGLRGATRRLRKRWSACGWRTRI